MAVIHIMCACGKYLQAPEEAERKGFDCPACGRRVGGRAKRPRQPAPVQRPVILDAPILLPQWEESKGDSRDEPRYRVVSEEEEADLKAEAERNRERPKRRKKRGDYDAAPALMVPFLAGKPLLFLSLALACGVGLVLLQLARAGTLLESAEGSVLAGALCVLLLFQAGCWYSMLSAGMAGEYDLVSLDGRGFLRILVGVGYGVVCFLAGPAWLLLGAYHFWLNAGDLTWFDWCVVGELVAVAAAYWLFCLLAVTADGRVTSANPLRVVALVRWLGPVRAAVAACVAGAIAVVFGGLAWVCLAALHESVGAWLWLMTMILSAQVCTAYLLVWLGTRCGALLREQRRATPPDGDGVSPHVPDHAPAGV